MKNKLIQIVRSNLKPNLKSSTNHERKHVMMKPKQDAIAELVRELEKQDLTKWPCPYAGKKDGCTVQPFASHQARNNHIRFFHPNRPLPKMGLEESMARRRIHQRAIRHGLKGKRSKSNWPSNTPAYRREHYDEAKLKFALEGRNAQGRPFKNKVMADRAYEAARAVMDARGEKVKPRLTEAGRAKLSTLMKERWKRSQAKGENSLQPQETNHKGRVEPIIYHAPFEVPIHECPGCKMKFPPGIVWREKE